jgi:ectoine hydroxylase-related dioxygenase (phytanoyl-CoA dioxygenase family)
MCQVNWWIPMYPIQPENAMAFHPAHWARAVKNGSSEYDYARWNEAGRKAAAEQIRTDTRKQPRPEEPVALDPQVRLICPPGGIIMFSAAQLHSTVPNTSGYTRFSIDFRTVHLDDVVGNQGALNVDSECTGTTMGDYLRCTDLANLPSEIIRRYETEQPPLAEVSGR